MPTIEVKNAVFNPTSILFTLFMISSGLKPCKPIKIPTKVPSTPTLTICDLKSFFVFWSTIANMKIITTKARFTGSNKTSLNAPALKLLFFVLF